jgi:multiple sugar transport system substrate-binding protein
MDLERTEYSRRKFLSRAGVVVAGGGLVPLLQACFGGATVSPSPSGTAGPSRAPGQTVVQFWSGADPATKALIEADLIPAFENANPDIKILANIMTFPEFFQKTQIAFAGDIAPDVVGSGFGQLGSLIGAGVLQPLDGIIEQWDDIEDIDPIGLDSGVKGDQRFALLLPNVYAFNYRRDHFEDAGLDPEKPPTDWDEVRTYAMSLTQRDGDAITRGGMDIPIKNGEQVFANFAFTNGLTNLWDEEGAPLYESPEALETIEYLLTLIHEDRVVVPSDQQAATGTAFAAGLAAQGFLPSQLYAGLEELAPGALAAAHPPVKTTRQALVLGTFYGLTANPGNQEASERFLRFLYSPESQWVHYEKAGFPPTRASLKDQFAAHRQVNATISDVLTTAVGWPIFPTFLQAREILVVKLEEIYLRQVEPAEGLKQAADETRRLLN